MIMMLMLLTLYVYNIICFKSFYSR